MWTQLMEGDMLVLLILTKLQYNQRECYFFVLSFWYVFVVAPAYLSMASQMPAAVVTLWVCVIYSLFINTLDPRLFPSLSSVSLPLDYFTLPIVPFATSFLLCSLPSSSPLLVCLFH